jgi:hypothetical protein
MSDNTQLPAGLDGHIEHNAINFYMANRTAGIKDAYISGATEYAIKLHQAERNFDKKLDSALHVAANDFQRKMNELQKENLRQYKALQAKCERYEAALREAKGTINWMWQHMKEPDGQTLLRVDEFNRPANALHVIDEALAEQPGKLTKERADLIREVNGRDLNGTADAVIAALKAKGDKLALELRRCSLSMTVHPDYEPNSEFRDRVAGAEEALAEWSGEKEVKPEPKYYTDDDLRGIISMVCDQLNEGFNGREEFIEQTIAVFAGKKAEIDRLRKLGVNHPNPHLCENENKCGYPDCGCLPF